MGEDTTVPPPTSEAPMDDSSSKSNNTGEVFDGSSIQYRAIRDGFVALRNSLDGHDDADDDDQYDGRSKHTVVVVTSGGEDEKPDSKLLNSFVTVNFVDPTSGSDVKIKPTAKQPLELYDKLANIFEKEYRSTLRQVPY